MSRVSIVRCPGYEINALSAALTATFDNLGGLKKYIKPGMKVVLKPNLVMKKRPEEAATTHPALVYILASMIQEAGGIVTIAESPGGPHTEAVLRGVYSVCGMQKVATETGLRLNYDLSYTDVDNPSGKYLKKVTVIKPLLEADLVINLPKLKTHGQMVYTGAVKNMFGAVPGGLKAEYHMKMAKYDEFANTLIDIFLAVKPALNIMDAVIGMDGRGPTAGNPKQIGLILAGEDAFALDLAALSIINLKPGDVPVIRQAIARGLCPGDLKEVELVGEAIKDVKVRDFVVPGLNSLKDVPFFNSGVLKAFGDMLKPRPVFMHNLCIGCSECARSCPAHIIEMKNKKPRADLSKCIRCFCCQELCPAKAITIKGSRLFRSVMGIGVQIYDFFVNRKK